MGHARQAFGVSGIREIERGRLLGWGFLVVLLAEFRRARAAAQRYQDLRYRSACYGYPGLADIPARIFEEFYSSGRTVEGDSKPQQCAFPRR
jgi:hypothetical protein